MSYKIKRKNDQKSYIKTFDGSFKVLYAPGGGSTPTPTPTEEDYLCVFTFATTPTPTPTEEDYLCVFTNQNP